jgi:multiple sugar transport system substrate-binding protein
MISESTAMYLFGSGAIAMMPDLSIRISHFAELLGRDVQIAPLPRQVQQATIFHNLSYAVSAKTKNPDAVRKFISFLASKRAAEIVAHTFAPCFNGMAELTFAGYDWANAHYIPESINYGYPLPIASRNAGSAWTMVENGLAGIWATAGQVGNQLADLENQVNAEIAR